MEAFHYGTHVSSGGIFAECICLLDAVFALRIFLWVTRKCVLHQNMSRIKMRPGQNVISKNNGTHKEMRPAKNQPRNIFQVLSSDPTDTPF